ncbi:HAD family hydrolase [Paenibacillus sp. KACC 21273]|uniref:D-glycero-alpha-D-manno-heptose-1,7-bisphosphate 7-phosphatase n=1 Tax=Paenibacillus sp. KACC 21273 TaxID=3025665 RepID=UPI0023668CE2|nr:HAD family hydrolase [Paenibacillus sp. KACC 21273]WDF52848.1 HAD family hydrolase [Paenibacillus sp. KACC 21273]
MQRKAVFIDRDGTLGGTGRGMHPDEFIFYPGVPSAIKQLNDANLLVFIITNQARISRRLFSEIDLQRGMERLQRELNTYGAFFDDYFYCPHHENEGCDCRKPRPGLIRKAREEYPNINIEESYVIGDLGEADIKLGCTNSMKTILVLTGCGLKSMNENRHLWADYSPNHIANNLEEAIKIILKYTIKEES